MDDPFAGKDTPPMTVTNWSRRYRTADHWRLCARPGCGELATTTLRFQPTRREAWLIDVEEDAPRTSGDLCDRHAVALELPRGWQLHDHRIARGEVTLVVVGEATVEAEPEIEIEIEIEPEPEAVIIELGTDAAAASIPEDDDEAVEEVVEELAEVLDARTPLLQRAFGNVIRPD
jgi:hypothetical protein